MPLPRFLRGRALGGGHLTSPHLAAPRRPMTCLFHVTPFQSTNWRTKQGGGAVPHLLCADSLACRRLTESCTSKPWPPATSGKRSRRGITARTKTSRARRMKTSPVKHVRMTDVTARNHRSGIVSTATPRTAGMWRSKSRHRVASNASGRDPLTCAKRLLATARPT